MHYFTVVLGSMIPFFLGIPERSNIPALGLQRSKHKQVVSQSRGLHGLTTQAMEEQMATERPLERVGGAEIVYNGAGPRGHSRQGTFDPALTVEEVAEKLKVSPATVYALLRAGALTSYKVGRSWRVDELDLVEYIERQKARNGAGLSTVELAENGLNPKRNNEEGQRPA